MTVRALLVDDIASHTSWLSNEIRGELSWEVVVVNRVADVAATLAGEEPFDIAVVDLHFQQERSRSGLDVLVAIRDSCATTRLVVMTQGGDTAGPLLDDAWQALELDGAISKVTDGPPLMAMLHRIVTEGPQPPDPLLQPWLPRSRSPWRRADQFSRLVQHAGHAKLWRALMESETVPSHKELARATGLGLNTIKNYRAQLVSHLALFELDDSSLRDMHAFARRCRPLLEPHIDARLSGPA